jgi:hypothetical protein
MKQSLLFWILAFFITVGSAIYQRRTGPTYPFDGTIILNGKVIHYQLERSHAGETNHPVKIETNDASVSGYVEWKRFKTSDDWTKVLMAYNNGVLSASLPRQPLAGKLEYRVTLQNAQHTITLPEKNAVVIRFRGDVPATILIIHVALMFIGLIFSTRAGLEFFSKQPKLETYIVWTIGLFAIGGLIFGPLVQKYAFGTYWTGLPFGTDLTDNKTAVMVLVWIIAAIALKKFKNPKRWALAAAILTLIVYLIPHSVLGSEIDYSKTNRQHVSMMQMKEGFKF